MTAYIITIVVESLIIALGIGLGIYGVVRHRRRQCELREKETCALPWQSYYFRKPPRRRSVQPQAAAAIKKEVP